MKEFPLSICERTFVTKSIKENLRLDGRKNDEFRAANINFGADWGSVIVSLGETKVLGQVSCELGLPKATRPNEGMMFINVELGPMAAPHFEAGRNSDLNVQINRTLERTFKDSRCVDLESLCVTAEDQVWILRVDLNVLNHDGNLIDCCSIATLCALAHFRRPDVSVDDDEVKIHTAAEKELIPMVLHHYPVCVTYNTFDDGTIAIADPTAIEETVAESQMVFGLNSFQELCCLNLGGSTLTSSHLLLQCANRAAKRAKALVDLVKELLQTDAAAREAGQIVGFTECMRLNKITALAEDRLALKLPNFSFKSLYEQKPDQDMNEASTSTGDEKSNIRWLPEDDEADGMDVVDMDTENVNEESDDEDQALAHQVESALKNDSARANKPISKQKQQPMLFSRKNLHPLVDSDDSEEENTMVL